MNEAAVPRVLPAGDSSEQRAAEKIHEIRRACRKHKTAFFFKQWGGAMSKSGGRTLDRRTYDEMPRPRVKPAASVISA